MDKVIVSDSPHIRKSRTTKGIMLDVLIALIPAAIAGCVYFGWKALLILVISVLSAVASEVIYSLCAKKSIHRIIKEFDFTSVITGLLLGMTLSSAVPWYVPMLGSAFAIIAVKMLFGGTGKNIVNPAIAGRIFAFIAFQSVMISGWVNPNYPALEVMTGASNGVNSGATALTTLLQEGLTKLRVSNLDLFLGTGVQGCIGETSKLALLVGGVYLAARKVIDWKWPVIYIGVTGLITVFLHKCNFDYFLPSILSGGLFLGAIFMATDYVTSPNNDKASYIYYVLLGVVTALLRYATGIEVVSFAILLMNLIVPLLNTHVRPRPFGSKPYMQIIKEKFAKKAVKEGKNDR